MEPEDGRILRSDLVVAPLAAVILAAGQGQRLGGRPKAALRIGDSSLLERLVGAVREAGIPEVSVVLGPYLAHLLPLAAACGAQALQHPQPASTLIASQRLALEAHASRHAGFDLLLVLADLPLLDAADILALLAAWRQRPASVQAQVPQVGTVRGHPVLLSWAAVEAVRATPSHLGIRDWLARHPQNLQVVTSDRVGYVTDLDTPADLAAVRARLAPLPVAWPDSLAGQG